MNTIFYTFGKGYLANSVDLPSSSILYTTHCTLNTIYYTFEDVYLANPPSSSSPLGLCISCWLAVDG